ncbi:unnamed protein product [Didymodactylos carnosus]|uniref:NAD(P)(+)--arginine ADP-ribosyltransferase n=1 Tax=Didymodactylos carnosus TaxID=1234261 RepID=A0A815N6S1_9BILA|nr:unnamed protein product [Didymodactylos carnosus]CAF4309004.1 unnamed protein product [Didymodactylos carnosus]
MATVQQLTRSRYTDICGEPVDKLLVPVKGYQNELLLPLEEAVVQISDLFEDLQEYVYIAKQNCKKPSNGLTQDESAAIQLYTMQFSSGPSFYELFNQTLRSENRELLKPWFRYLKLFLTALYKLRSEPQQTVWRGVKGVDLSGKYSAGVQFAWGEFHRVR